MEMLKKILNVINNIHVLLGLLNYSYILPRVIYIPCDNNNITQTILIITILN